MTTTTLAAIFILFLVSTFAQYVSSFSRIDIISDISAVLLLGLATDLMNTWMLNTGILKWYLGREVPIGKRKRGGRK
jgi:preprotein translocase subunit SecF